MPSTITHYLFNKDLIKDDKYAKIFLLGGQGADVFFFYGYNIKRRENSALIREFGTKIHSIDPDKLYKEMLNYAFSKEGEEKEILVNFVRGFMYHYCLDRNVHPYIFYHTGFPYTNPKYSFGHGKLESILDTLLLKEYNYKISTRKSIKANNKQVKICSKMFKYIADIVFSIDYINEDSYYNAYKDFRFVRLIIDSKFGIKKWFFNKFKNKSKINSICQPHKVKDDIKYDYLNKNKREWIIPDSGEKTNDSINDLFKKSELDTRIVDTIIYNYKDNIVTQRKLTKFTSSINHDGKHMDKNMIYFKSIFKDENK